MSKIVAVTGATGSQGGAVARALLKEKQWKVIGLTRDVESEKAKQLKLLGADLRACDLNNISDVESALKGVDAVFVVTDFWGNIKVGHDSEVRQGKNLVDVAKKLGLHHFVYSSLESALKISDGKRGIPHFDTKAEVEEYLVKSGIPYTIVQAAGYYENLKRTVQPNASGQLEFTLPISGDSKFAQFSVEDTGLVVREVLNNPSKYLSKKIAMVGEIISPNEMATILSSRKKVTFNSVPEQVFAGFPFPGAAEIANMFTFFQEYGYFGEKKNQRRYIGEGKEVAKLRTFAEWAQTWKL